MENPADPVGIAAAGHRQTQSFESDIQNMSVDDLRALLTELDNASPGPYSRADYKRRLLWMELQRREGDRRRAERTEASLEKLREERQQERAPEEQQVPPVFVHGRWLAPREVQDLATFIRWVVTKTDVQEGDR